MKRTVRGLGAMIGAVAAPVNSIMAERPPALENFMPDGLQRPGAICLIPVVVAPLALLEQAAGQVVDAAPSQALWSQ
jgi:hypothetical protein